jgi:phosphomannomutase
LTSAPALMITASHNEPEWNGMKFIVNGRGISQEDLDKMLLLPPPPSQRAKKRSATPGGDGKTGLGNLTLRQKSSYNRELVERVGVRSGEGVSAAIDLNGGAAIHHAPAILEGVGCRMKVIGGTEGIFSRTIDPTNDDLRTLTETVRREELDVGFAFDCDGDRLVMVDDRGEKKSGDFMLALALKNLLPNLENKSVVISVDTSRAVEDVVSQAGGTIFRTKVGEANVVAGMVEKNATLGGEGSSGGLIDGSYNYCRDSMIAVTVIVKALKRSGSRVFREVPVYKQVRLRVAMERRKALAAVKRMQKEEPEANTLDGLKVETSKRSWVLIRVSGTEDVVRVSAESPSTKEAQELADSYGKRIKKLA